jgi:preprotein translocase subunit Sss1
VSKDGEPTLQPSKLELVYGMMNIDRRYYPVLEVCCHLAAKPSWTEFVRILLIVLMKRL